MTDQARKAGHTKGPWEWYEEGYQAGRFSRGIRSPHGQIAKVFGIAHLHGREISRANARLIAAAPDLLEALERCEAMVSSSDGPPNWDWIRSVIAKAKSEA